YPYVEERKAEMACVAIHPDYRDGNRGQMLLNHMKQRTKSDNIHQIFVLTTRSLHWFREQGFYEVSVDYLPGAKQGLYNFQRKSKILALDL
ncbi:GNAT family N-acetyltransferase, partial [Vibrio astriarenae]